MPGAVDRFRDARPTVGVFHSLSALASLLSPTSRYAALVLFDPPNCNPAASRAGFDKAAERLARKSRKRGCRFLSEEEFTDLLGSMSTFLPELPGFRQQMAKTALRRRPGGEMELRCPREFEAQIVDCVRSCAPLLDLATLPRPTRAIGTDPALPYFDLPIFDLHHVSAVDDDLVPENTHRLRPEQPVECITCLRNFLLELGLAQSPS